MTIYFDMDGTIADLYNVENWLPKLRNSDPSPYLDAKPLLHFSTLARLLNAAQRSGINIGIISWTSKGGSATYNQDVMEAKRKWLRKHLPASGLMKFTLSPMAILKNCLQLMETSSLMIVRRSAKIGLVKRILPKKFLRFCGKGLDKSPSAWYN